MNIQPALKSQYHAALKTLRLAVEKCPDALWDDPGDGAARFWRVVYHTLFYTHFYLQQDQHSFTPWASHREEANYIASVPGDNFRPPLPCDPYSRDELLDYWRICDHAIDSGVDALDLSAPSAGFRGTRCRPWNTRSSTFGTSSITRPLWRLACAAPRELASIGSAGPEGFRFAL